jgi:hypothetical protein
VTKETDAYYDYYANLPHPSERPKVMPGPPDTPDHLMTERTWGTALPEPDAPVRVRRGREALIVIHQGLTAAYCPREPCTNVELIFDVPDDPPPGWTPPQEIYHPRPGRKRPSMFHCSNCRYVGPLEWPDDYDDIADELERRPVPQTRNWYPEGHPFATLRGIPAGQSVADLRAEFAEHAGSI